METLKYTEILQLNKALSGKITSKPYNIGLLSNVTVNSFKEILEYKCRLNQIEPHVEIGNFDNILQDSASFSSNDLVIVFYDTLNIVDSVSTFFEDLSPEDFESLKNKMFGELSMVFVNLKDTPSVIFNSFSDAYFQSNFLFPSKINQFVTALNIFVQENAPNNFNIVNIDKIYTELGIGTCYDKRFYASSKAPYTVGFLKAYTFSIEGILLKNNGKLKKAMIFDCDNTLWKGILGEDGIDNIDMSASSKYGAYYNKIQKMAVFLSKRGIIIGLCSKNNEADVIEVLRTHKDQILKEEHIVIHKINWQDKASNIRAIASELNIGLDSLVFVDDSSFEINLIKEQVPEVLALQVPENISEFPDFVLKNVYRYFNLNPTKDDVKKTQMYKEQFKRESSKNAFGSIDDYLASLEIELKIAKNDEAYIPRISQLTQKTNQFNLTTIRYTETQIKQFMDNSPGVFAMFVKDKFGDSGLTGVCIIGQSSDDPKKAYVDSLLMSCRILGRNIEFSYVNTIFDNLAKAGFTDLEAKYIPTKKNAQVEDFYDKIGFTLSKVEDGTKYYYLNLLEFSGKKYDYIKVINT